MLDWYKKRNKDQIVILKKVNNSYRYIKTVFTSEENETKQIKCKNTKKEIAIKDNPCYLNKHSHFTYYLDFENEKFLNFDEIDIDYDPVALSDLSNNNLAKSILTVFGEDVSKNKKLLIIMTYLGGLGSGFILYQMMLRFVF